MNDHILISYPRKVWTRRILAALGRVLVRILFRVEISGLENFPNHGPLIVVGNHTAIMETVLLIIFSPMQIEMLGAADIPHEKFNQIISDIYGFIPVKRGSVDRPALKAALQVLDQRGVIGLFPEGGIWDPGSMRAQTGVSWLSYHGSTPVLPIGFSGTLGAIDQALKLRRPKITMKFGLPIEPLQKQAGTPRKTLFENYSEYVMSEVRKLIRFDDPSLNPTIKDEWFEFDFHIQDLEGKSQSIPDELCLEHKEALARFLHRPAILKIFRNNLKLPIEVLENLHEVHDPVDIKQATELILDYLDKENPYLLVYRFGPKLADDMKVGLTELLKLSSWAATCGYRLHLIPIRHFYSLVEHKDVTQIQQSRFSHWM